MAGKEESNVYQALKEKAGTNECTSLVLKLILDLQSHLGLSKSGLIIDQLEILYLLMQTNPASLLLLLKKISN